MQVLRRQNVATHRRKCGGYYDTAICTWFAKSEKMVEGEGDDAVSVARRR